MSNKSTGKTSNKQQHSSSNKPAQQHSASNRTVTGRIKHGNQDSDKKHDLTDLNVRPDQYVVRHFSTFTSPSGTEMEDPGSSRLQVYDKEDFDRLSEQKKVNGKMQPSAFEQQGLGVDIVHEPE